MVWSKHNVGIDTSLEQDVAITGSLTVDTKIKLNNDTLTTATNIPLIIQTDSLIIKPYGESTPNGGILDVRKHDGTSVFKVNPNTGVVDINGSFNAGSIGISALDLDNIDIDGNIIKIDTAGRSDGGVDNRVQIEQLLVKIGSDQADLFTVQDSSGANVINVDTTASPNLVSIDGLLSTGSRTNLGYGTNNAEVHVGASQKAYIGVGTQADYSNYFNNDAAVVINTVGLKGDGGSQLNIRKFNDSGYGNIIAQKVQAIGNFRLQGTGTYISGYNDTDIDFQTNDETTVMRLETDTGFLGINTTTPGAALHAVGTNAGIFQQTAAADCIVTIQAGSTKDAILKFKADGGSASADITNIFQEDGVGLHIKTTNNTVDAMTILCAGSVGIGETSPDKLLHLKGDDVDGSLLKVEGNSSYGGTIEYHRGGSYHWRAGIGGSGSTNSNIPSSNFGIEDAANGDVLRFSIGHSNGLISLNRTGNKEVARFTSTGITGSRITILSDSGNSSTVGERDGHLVLQDSNTRRVAIGFDQPDTLFHMSGADPYMTFTNTASEDTTGGRESKLIFEGTTVAGGATYDAIQHHLAEIKVSHSGSANDKKGLIEFKVNDGNDSNGSLQTGLTINSDSNVIAGGNVSVGSTVGVRLGFNKYNTDAVGLFGHPDGVAANSDGNLWIAPRNINSGNTAYIMVGQRSSTDDNEKGNIVIRAGEEGSGDADPSAKMQGNIDINSNAHSGRVYIKGDTGFVGIGHNSPDTKFHIEDSSPPHFTMANSTAGDSDGDRESKIVFEGKNTSNSKVHMAEMKVIHDGTSNDSKGRLEFRINDGNDSNGSLTHIMSMISESGSNPRIGMGTTTPEYQLDISGNPNNAATVIRVKSNDSSDARISFAGADGVLNTAVGVNGNSYDLEMLTKKDINFYTNSDMDDGSPTNIRAKIDMHGDFLIGDIANNSPDAALRVQTSNTSVNSPFAADNDNDNPYVNNYNLSLYNHGSSGSSTNEFEQYSTLAFNPNSYDTNNTHSRLTALIAARTISRAQGTGELMFGVCSSTGASAPTHKVTVSNSGIALYNKKLPNLDGNVAPLSDDGARANYISFYGINRGSSDHTTMSAYENDVIDNTNGSNAGMYRQGYLKMSHSGTARDKRGKFEGYLGTGTAWNSNEATFTKRFIYVPTAPTGDGILSTCLGVSAGEGDPDYSVAIGYQALKAHDGSANSVAIGYKAMLNNDSGARNIAIGSNALTGETSASNTSDNIAIGHNSLEALNGGDDNIAIGSYAGLYNVAALKNIYIGSEAGKNIRGTTGLNTAIGYKAMYNGSSTYDNNVANNNVVIGAYSMASEAQDLTSKFNVLAGVYAGTNMTTSDNCTLIGYQSGYNLTTANYNTFIGNASGLHNTTGTYNTFVGASTASSSANPLTGNNNLLVGYASGYDLEGGSTENTFVGAYAGKNTQVALKNVALGMQSLEYAISSDRNVVIGMQCFNNHGKANGQADGSTFDSVGGNVGMGYRTGYNNTRGIYNTFIGYSSGYNIDGDYNVALGAYSLRNGDTGVLTDNTGDNNIAVGHYCMGNRAASDVEDFTGSHNIGMGTYALSKIMTGLKNIAIGYHAGEQIIGGGYNVCIGSEAGTDILGGNYNIAIGHHALTEAVGDTANVAIGQNSFYFLDDGNSDGTTTATYNVGVGDGSGKQVSTGTQCTFIGAFAGESVSSNRLTGSKHACLGYKAGKLIQGASIGNTLVGHEAGDGITTGSDNVGVGRATAFDVDADNQICIGYQATTSAANSVKIGNASIANANIQVDWTIDSDRRIKKDIEDNTLGLAFINDLKPKKYKKLHPADWDEAIREKRYEDGTRDEFDDKKVWDGLIAQEVKEAIEKNGTSFSGWSVDANGKQGIQYSALVIPLINAVQELSKEVERLKNEL